ncbi:hypothetical protein A8C56_03405 [Niabella ginsenosidivorans]|uniref:Uncharacterized protein n=1 Tax=Niabella ginsenosidivorans TaxID=1176587 RepID=A0A1A9HZC4_9BACT|nr:hypothetical protein A8C56_03405 [Niabella ginsenosidivorans]
MLFCFIGPVNCFPQTDLGYISSDRTLYSGDYTAQGWGYGVTLTIPKGETVTITSTQSNMTGYALLVNGTLTLNGLNAVELVYGGYLTLGDSARFTINASDHVAFNGPRDLGKYSVLTVNSLLNVSDVNVTLREGATSNLPKGYNNNIVATNGSTLHLEKDAKIVASGFVNLNGGSLFMDAGSLVTVTGDLHFHHANSTIAGTVEASGMIMFHEPGIILDCGAIISDTFNVQSEAPPLDGSGYIEIRDVLIGDGNALISAGAGNIVYNINSTGAGGNIGGGTPGTAPPASCDIALPVSFGVIRGLVRNNQLQVSWTTLTEKNNDHFEIETSGDGRQFQWLASVPSKAIDGSSDTPLSYSYNKPYDVILTASVLMAVLLTGFSRSGRKTSLPQWLFALYIITLAACNKGTKDISARQGERQYIRIVQVDKEGTRSYSKVVKVLIDE